MPASPAKASRSVWLGDSIRVLPTDWLRSMQFPGGAAPVYAEPAWAPRWRSRWEFPATRRPG